MRCKELTGNVLIHYGVKGMKWGVRRYQNHDGNRKKRNKSKKTDSTVNTLSTAIKKGLKDIPLPLKALYTSQFYDRGIDYVLNSNVNSLPIKYISAATIAKGKAYALYGLLTEDE